MDPSELITGSMPFLAYSQPQSMNISTGGAPVMTGGVSTAPEIAGSVSAGGAMAQARASGSAILFTWIALVVILVAANVLTLRVQG